jgi:hypothetical protein
MWPQWKYIVYPCIWYLFQILSEISKKKLFENFSKIFIILHQIYHLLHEFSNFYKIFIYFKNLGKASYSFQKSYKIFIFFQTLKLFKNHNYIFPSIFLKIGYFKCPVIVKVLVVLQIVYSHPVMLFSPLIYWAV